MGGLMAKAVGEGPGWAALPTVSGTVTYRERIALPPTAELTVRLLDASRAGAAPAFLNDVTAAADGAQVPLAFAVPYDPATIAPQGAYVVEAEIVVGGVVRFRTAAPLPVLTRGAPAAGVEVLVRSAAG